MYSLVLQKTPFIPAISFSSPPSFHFLPTQTLKMLKSPKEYPKISIGPMNPICPLIKKKIPIICLTDLQKKAMKWKTRCPFCLDEGNEIGFVSRFHLAEHLKNSHLHLVEKHGIDISHCKSGWWCIVSNFEEASREESLAEGDYVHDPKYWDFGGPQMSNAQFRKKAVNDYRFNK